MLVLSLLLGLAATVASSVAPDGEIDPDCVGDDAVTWLGPALTLVAGGAELGASLAVVELLSDGLGEGEGDGDGDGDGDGVAGDGRAWHAVFVVDAVEAACAVPGALKVRKLPLSTVTAASLTCAQCIKRPVFAARQGCPVLS